MSAGWLPDASWSNVSRLQITGPLHRPERGNERVAVAPLGLLPLRCLVLVELDRCENRLEGLLLHRSGPLWLDCM